MDWRSHMTILLSVFVVIFIFISFPVFSDVKVSGDFCSNHVISFPAGPHCFLFLCQAGVFKLPTQQIEPCPKPPASAPWDAVPTIKGLTDDRKCIFVGWICHTGAISISQFTPGSWTVITSNYFKCFSRPCWGCWDSDSCHELIRLRTCSPVNFNLIIFCNSIISINFSIWIRMRCYLPAPLY